METSDLPQKRPKPTQLKIITWNVCGIRSIIKKSALTTLIESEHPDILCLNETKLQSLQVSKIQSEFPKDYFSYFSCSSTKKGYSGVAILTKIKPLSIQTQGHKRHDDEGRTLIAEFSEFFLVATYVPCAGERLKRLDYRVNSWDSDMRNTLKSLSKVKNVIWCGDLNVVNEEIDIYCLKGKEKSGCCTPEERISFKKTLDECGLVDSLRVVHPELRKWSYFPRRNVKAREKGQGWRLDYILVSEKMKEVVQDASIRNDYEGSDHYPVIVVLQSSD